MDLLSYLLSRKYTDNSIKGISGALAGKNCTIESATKQDGVTTVVFKWTADDGVIRRTNIQVEDGTPIYAWVSGDHYKIGALAIYENDFYKCIVENSDIEFDDSKWDKLGSSDGNYDIVQSTNLLPVSFTVTDKKMYYVINDECFYFWNGTEWVKQGVASQYTIMPTATEQYLDKIVQYVGETNNNFVNGKFYKCVGNSYPVVYSWKPINGDDTFVTLEMFGAVGDGVTNDTSAFIQALNSGKEIHLMNKTYLIGANITQDHTTIKGKGKIKGTLTINASYVNISDIEFQSGGSCIVLQSGKYITFDKIKTDMCKNSFYIPKPSQHQPISRVLISNSILASEYGFNCDDDEYTYYSIGDLQIVNTQFFSKIYGIRGKWIDGLVITGCTFFTQAHEAQLTDKKNNINVTGSNYVNITGCNLFEAGEESIYLSGVRGVTVNGNNIVWCGQVVPSGGIVIDGLKQNVDLTSIVISNNNIQYPTDDAIIIKNISDVDDADENYVISITDNTILNALGTTFYYGTEPLKNMVYVVNSSTTNPNKVLIDNNIGTGSVYPPYAMTNKQITDIIPSDTSINNKLVNDDKLNDVNQLIADGYTNYEYELALGFYDANGRWNDSSKHASVHDLLSLPSGLTLYFSSTVSGATPNIKEYSSDGTRIRNISGNPAILTDTNASNRYNFDLLKNSGYEEVPTSGYLMQSVPNYFAEINTDMEQTKTRLDALENRSVYTYDVLTSTLTLINQHTKYVIKRVVEQSINLDSWRLYAGYVKINDQWSNMWLNSDAEGPIKIDNESDFISGFHGDEILQDFTIYKDNEIFDTSVNSEGLLDSLVLYQTSTVYRANSQEAAFTRYKKVSFQGDNYSVQQRWISLISCTITESALALLQCYKTNIIGWDADTLIPLQSKDSGNVELDNGTRRGNIILNGGEMVSIIAEKGSDDFEADLTDYTDQNRIKFYFRMFKGKILNVGDVLNSKFSVLLNDYI